jgi:hypothetical protein
MLVGRSTFDVLPFITKVISKLLSVILAGQKTLMVYAREIGNRVVRKEIPHHPV